MIRKEEITFDSRDGQTKIHAVRWVPEGKVVCILQIVHGMAEYVERYQEFAEFLCEKGILVTGEDHLGHGKSASGGVYGYFCEQDPATVVVRDVHRLKKITQEEYPGIPYVILGHSMGSFILRNYLCRYGTGIQGAVICGTGFVSPVLSGFGLAVAGILGAIFGQKHVSGLMDKLIFGSNNKRISQPADSFDWLCTDPQVVKAYREDPLCGFVFTVNGFKTLFTLLRRLKEENLNSMPSDLPVYFIAGQEDPVGDYGEGVKKAYESFEKAGMQKLSIKLYPGCRHELLNEKNRRQVYEDVYRWLLERIKAYQL